MRLLVTGGCGFVGSNLAERALREGFEVAVFDNLQQAGSAGNLSWLRETGLRTFFHGDIRISPRCGVSPGWTGRDDNVD
jgi:CDP-paratose 2-epimerase